MNTNWRFAMYGAIAGFLVMRQAVRGRSPFLEYQNFLQETFAR